MRTTKILIRKVNQRAQHCFVFTTTISVIFLISFVIITDILPKELLPWTLPVEKINGNYFLDVDRIEEMGLLVNNSNCKIPNFSPWDPAMIPFIRKAEPIENCTISSYDWSFVDKNKLVIKTNRMEEDGYSFTNGSCCYKIIKRVEQSENNYNSEADNLIEYSSCIPITKIRTEISAQFIMVECSMTTFLLNRIGVAYRGFHGFGYPQHDKTLKKIAHWQQQNKEQRSNQLPPNILVLGIDSTSRLNFQRNMFKTHRILKELGATEMLGYTKVGENTYPNFCAIFQGYSREQVNRICYNSSKAKQDDCPFIWKRLDAANYLTAQIEDAPAFTAFNYLQTGFVKQPVDFYSRTLFQAAHDYGLPLHLARSEHMDCIGPQTNDETIATYVENTLDFAIRNETPIFTFSWSTTLSHNIPNYIQLADDTYSRLLQRLKKKGQLENTILIFMGDHGYRFGPWRETLVGYYEDKLPNFWISLPSWIKQRYPEWQRSLEINSERLASPYTLYWTLNHILDTFTNTKAMDNSKDENTGETIVRKYRQTFLEPVPELNSCEDVGVPEVHCPCYPLQKISLDNPVLINAAITATNKVNRDNFNQTKYCAPLKVSKITAGARMNKTHKFRYIIGFETLPGRFLFEAEVDYFPNNKTFSDNNINVQRANKINKNFVKCVSDARLELFCYCSS